jgi:hypothetical protein
MKKPETDLKQPKEREFCEETGRSEIKQQDGN